MTEKMRRVIIESPYAGDVEKNVRYARRCMSDSLHRGEAPLASHLLYTQPGILKDEIPGERSLGIEAGLEWGRMAEVTAVYSDFGVTSGMKFGIQRAHSENRPVEFREIGKND